MIDAICGECMEYTKFNRNSDGALICEACLTIVSPDDVHHVGVESDDWCGEQSCPRCQGYNESPDAESDDRPIDLTELDALVDLSTDDAAERITKTIENVSIQTGVSIDEAHEAAVSLAMCGYHVEHVESMLLPICEYSILFGCPTHVLADTVAEFLHAYSIDDEYTGSILQNVRSIVISKPTTYSEVFDVLIRMGPIIQHCSISESVDHTDE